MSRLEIIRGRSCPFGFHVESSLSLRSVYDFTSREYPIMQLVVSETREV